MNKQFHINNFYICEHIWNMLSPVAKKKLLEISEELEGEDYNEHR